MGKRLVREPGRQARNGGLIQVPTPIIGWGTQSVQTTISSGVPRGVFSRSLIWPLVPLPRRGGSTLIPWPQWPYGSVLCNLNSPAPVSRERTHRGREIHAYLFTRNKAYAHRLPEWEVVGAPRMCQCVGIILDSGNLSYYELSRGDVLLQP